MPTLNGIVDRLRNSRYFAEGTVWFYLYHIIYCIFYKRSDICRLFPEIGLAICASGYFSLTDIPLKNLFFIILIICVGLIIVFALIDHHKNISIDTLKKENKDLIEKLDVTTQAFLDDKEEIEIELREWIRTKFAKDLNIMPTNGSGGHPALLHDRVSIYLYFPKKECFYLCARHATDRLYERKRRTKYPPEKGVLFKAWRQSSYLGEYPDPTVDLNGYYLGLERDDIRKDESEKIRMQCPFVYGYCIEDTSKNPLGVIVIESQKPDRFDKTSLDHYCHSKLHKLPKNIQLIEHAKRICSKSDIFIEDTE